MRFISTLAACSVAALIVLCLARGDAYSAYTTSGVEAARAAKLREIAGNAQGALERLGDYRVRMRRRELLSNNKCHEDVVMLTIRAKPFAVHVKCLPGGENEGREILYVPGHAENQLQVLTGKGDILSGMRMDVSLNSEVVTANARRSLDQAGFGKVVERLTLALDRYLSGQVKVSEFEPIGLQTRSESRAPMEVVVQRIPSGEEPLLPHGGTRYWHFNADADALERHLPTLIITFNDRGQEVEYYNHDRLLPKITLEAQDFNADRLWSR